MDEDRRKQAEESIAPRFSRLMGSTVSPYGMFTDPPLVSVLTAGTMFTALYLAARYPDPMVRGGLAVFALAPVIAALIITVRLRQARGRVVDWLAGLPFPIVNMNGLLHGVAHHLTIRFEESRPPKHELNEVLEGVHPDSFALEFAEDGKLEVDVLIGVLDSKLNPARAHYQRFRRVTELVERVLIPMSKRHPITQILVG